MKNCDSSIGLLTAKAKAYQERIWLCITACNKATFLAVISIDPHSDMANTRMTRSMTRENSGWSRLPTELRHMIVYEVMASSLPIPSTEGLSKDFPAFYKLVQTMASISFSFARNDIFRPFLQIKVQLTDLYDQLRTSSKQISVAVRTGFQDITDAGDDLMRKSSIVQQVSRLHKVQEELLRLCEHVLECLSVVTDSISSVFEIEVCLLTLKCILAVIVSSRM